MDCLLPSKNEKQKPVLLYLPGLDGSGLTAFVQYPMLSEEFELRCLTVPTGDRSNFFELVNLVRTELRALKGREVIVMGESFGGLLALGTTLETVSNRPPQEGIEEEEEGVIKGVVLVNPATSFSRTIWGRVGPIITKLPAPLYTLSLLPIGLLLIDGGQIQSLLKDALNKAREPKGQDPKARMAALGLSEFQLEFYTNALPMLIEKLDVLPAPCLEWRLVQWLSRGSEMVEPQLHRMKGIPVLTICGTVDRLLPSYQEAKRLARELPICDLRYVEGAGHGGTLDQRVNLLEILKGWKPVEELLLVGNSKKGEEVVGGMRAT